MANDPKRPDLEDEDEPSEEEIKRQNVRGRTGNMTTAESCQTAMKSVR